ncbi:MAG: DUF2225 domain-containing protein [bacterium]|nr:DUF2225 domain-containing protein [bacterium]
MAKIIFTTKKVLCPACKSYFELKYLNPKLYAASSRDDDERVTGYTWIENIKTELLPHHYSVLQCPKCLFTDFREHYERPGFSPMDKKLYQCHMQLSAEQRMVLQTLQCLVPAGDLDNEAALSLHLAAIFITLLPIEETAINHLKLGRLYLRLSWLYREQRELGSGPVPGDSKDTGKSSTTRKLSSAVEQLEEYIQSALDLLEEARQLSEGRTEELELPPDMNPFAGAIDSLEDNIEKSLQDLSQLENSVMEDRNRILMVKGKNGAGDSGVVEEKGSGGEGEDAVTLETLFPTLMEQWPQIPRSEESAIKLAVEAFDYSYKHEEVSQNVQQAMGVGNIILQLLQKTGDMDRALEYAVELYKTGFRDKQSLQMTLNQGQKDGSLGDEEVKEINRTLVVLSHTLEKAGASRKQLLGQLFERDKEKIFKILKANAAVPVQEQMQALFEAGIVEDMITYLKEIQVIKTDVKKKKWFGN